ncbi:arginine--tRNA ligase, partial [Patescibacteria group bacterium]
NDRGAHICKSILAYKLFGNGDTPEKSGLKGDHFVGKYYSMFGDKLKEDPSLEIKAKELLEKWENGNTTTLNLWETMNDWYYKGVNETYKKIGSEFDENYYESETYEHGKEIVKDALDKKIAYKKEDGAIAIDLTDEGLDEKILLRADGTSLYITQDIYTAVKRFKKHQLNQLIYVVGNEQNYHFQVLFKILQKLGYDFAKDESRLRHLSYGMVNILGGKLKSREGTKVDLDDLIEKLKNMAMKAMEEKNKQKTSDKLEDRAMRIGLAALKFMLLKVSPNKNIMFNPEEAISFEGDTGPYVMYSYVRIKSILRKAGKDGFIVPTEEGCETEIQHLKNGTSAKISDEEMKLAKLIYEFPDILSKSVIGIITKNKATENSVNPAFLANYLLELSGAFNHFYHIHKVIDAETKELKHTRLALINSVAIVLKKGMEILGIDMVEEM